MSDERLVELGIPRRSFLKRAAVAGFVAPVVASFALDGVAEGSTPYVGNQTCPNQLFANQFGQNIQGQNNDCQGEDNNNQH